MATAYSLDGLVGHDMNWEYLVHRARLRAMGHDPDFIGTTEVKPVCCEACGAQIPWRTLRGWQD